MIEASGGRADGDDDPNSGFKVEIRFASGNSGRPEKRVKWYRPEDATLMFVDGTSALCVPECKIVDIEEQFVLYDGLSGKRGRDGVS